MSNLFADIRVALRSLRRSPGLVLVATLSLSLGIAINITIITALQVLILEPLPYDEPDRLVKVWSTNPERGWDQTSVSIADYADWADQVTSLRLAAAGGGDYNLADADRPERVGGLRVTANYFDLLGVAPILGRGFRAEEETPGQGRVAMLGHGLWTRRFGGDSSVVGRSLRLDGVPHTVVGVLPDALDLGGGNDIYTPLTIDRGLPRRNRGYEVIGRLAAGATMEEAARELDAVAVRLEAEYPVDNEGMRTRVVSLKKDFVGDEASQAGLISLVAVLFVLLIACANVANLLLARGAVRERELAVRASLGATRGRLLRQLLVEGVMLSVVGGLVGVGLTALGIQWLLSILPADMPRLDEVRVGGVALGYGLLITALAGVGFSLAPALQSTSGNLVGPLHDGGRGGSVGRSAGRLRSAFVIGELGLALVLLISAGLLIKAAVRMQQQPLGFDRNGALTFRLSLPAEEYPDSAAVNGVLDRLVERLEAQPTVSRVGIVSRLPMRGGAATYFAIEGREVDEARRPVVQFRYASPGYLAAIGARLERGRFVEATDRGEAPPVVIVNGAFAERHFPDADPLTHRLVLSSGTYQIVGVMADMAEFGRDDPPPPVAYFPLAPRASPTSYAVVVRGPGDPAALGPVVRNALAEVAPTVPTYEMTSLSELIDFEEQSEMIMPRLLTVFGTIALLLAIIGVYGVMAYVVSTRSAEMGIRRALGAHTRHIVGLVFSHSGRLAAVGAVIGLALAALTARGLSTFLLGVSPFDPTIFAGVTVALVLAALGASLVPALRATRVSPTEALKSD
ncbi:MAG: ABC transporter permease [Gemmatimonadales bacterium]